MDLSLTKLTSGSNLYQSLSVSHVPRPHPKNLEMGVVILWIFWWSLGMRLPLCCLFFKGSIRHYDLCLSLSQLESHITYVSSQTEFWHTLCTRGSCFISNFKCILSTHDWVMHASRSGLSCRHLWTSVSLVLPTLCLRTVLSLSTQDCLPCPLLNLTVWKKVLQVFVQ